MSNVVELIPADQDWRPITEMDYVFDHIAPTLQRITNAVGDGEDFVRAIPEFEKLIAEFNEAQRKGLRLTL